MATLSEDKVAQYWRDGFVFPLRVMSKEKALELRRVMEEVETRYAGGDLPQDVGSYLRTSPHVVMPFASDMALEANVLDAVESILGPDLMIWGADFFIKEAETTKIVSWHQDLTYWGLGATSDQITAWIALSDVSVESGCMRFVAGSHKQAIVPHNDTFGSDNLLSRGQEIAVDVDEADATHIELSPGEMSLHHGLLFHASGPNTSSDRRIGLAVRFINPNARQEVAERDYAMLARGVDRVGGFTHFAPPAREFDAASLALYEEIKDAQRAALAQGATGDLNTYAAGM